jgi:hypothetical protein
MRIVNGLLIGLVAGVMLFLAAWTDPRRSPPAGLLLAPILLGVAIGMCIDAVEKRWHG